MNQKEIMKVIEKRMKILETWIDENEYPEDQESHQCMLNELQQLKDHINGVFEYDSYLYSGDNNEK